MKIWTYEKCEEIALKCKNKNELRNNYVSIHNKIRKNKWFELLEHFVELKKPNGYWTYEKCKEIALKYKSSKDIINNYEVVYNKIRKNKWFELLEHFIKLKKPNGYWIYDRCKEVALKCENKNEFQNKYSSAYNIIRKNKWYELLSHMKPIGNKYKRLIYVYEFNDNFCYIGLTGNIKRRKNQHLYKEKRSSVFLHIKKTNNFPTLLIKSDYINVNDAILLEEKILIEYKNKNWNILNKVKTGGIGSNNIKWDEKTCEIESKKYESISDFMKKSSGAYMFALKNDLIDKLFIRRKTTNNFWNNKELCRKESVKYSTRTDLHKNNWSAYNYSLKNNWLNEFYQN